MQPEPLEKNLVWSKNASYIYASIGILGILKIQR